MNDVYGTFLDGLEFGSALGGSAQSTAEFRVELEADIKSFMERGGTIESVDYDWSYEAVAKVGLWDPPGALLLADGDALETVDGDGD